jgi:hypothetical protein
VTNSAKVKGDRGELEVQDLLRGLLSIPTIRRELGAGRLDDRGDIDGVPDTALQVARTKAKYLTAVIKKKTIEVESQRRNRRVRLAASFIRWDRGPGWIVVMSPQQWATMWKYAKIGIDVTRRKRAAKIDPNGDD